VTVTVWLAVVLPVLLVHVNENFVVSDRPVTVCVPETILLPVHEAMDLSLDAVHELVLALVHVNVDAPPVPMLVGAALNVTVGNTATGGFTVTVTLAFALPPSPIQLTVNVLVAVNVPVLCVPDVALAPLQAPDAVQPVAF
jgi:hypothetical protein